MLLPKLKQIFRTSIGAGSRTSRDILLFFRCLDCAGGQGWGGARLEEYITEVTLPEFSEMLILQATLIISIRSGPEVTCL